MRILSPTENKRLNELIGFAGICVAVLLALSLLSYSSADPSFNVAAAGPASLLPADAAPALDLLADYHLTAEVRLFAS